MEQRLANTFTMTVNEKQFIESALVSDIRVDGRRPFDYRNLTIRFGSEDGSAEVQLGQTQVIAFVTGQLVQPYIDRPNEGTFAIFTEFSPMADPSFEPGRPGDSAIELGRIVDRGLRESRAVDTESLCVVAGKFVWSIRIDLHIIDNGGNLVDAANIAALAALSTFRRPECTFGGEDGQELIVHPPDVMEPLPLIIHHFPVAVTFGFIGEENIVVIDPTYHEEAVMGGSLTATLNTNDDVCAIQKAGGDGVLQSVVMQCLRIASVKAGDITSKIKIAVESYNTQRSLKKIKRHNPSSAASKEESRQVNPETKSTQQSCDIISSASTHEATNIGSPEEQSETLKDEVKLKHKKRKKPTANANSS
ncbi:exosome complex component RRP45A-like [Bidens hawaiensis]|uniref:exosome complex component RRP45A-like n=1 Tax=Bidens hawaiensis TaxID=980011 RepID=UPI0040493F92